jgi:hypothetical protein
MSQKTIRNLIIFLLINSVLAGYITVNYFIKSKSEESPATPVVTQPQPTKQPEPQAQAVVEASIPKIEEQVASTLESAVQPPSAPGSTPSAYKFPLPTPGIAENTAKTNVVSTQPASKATEVESSKVCVEMGPFNSEEKNTMEFILNKNKQSDLAKIEKMQAHQLYWNLGKNKADAERLFAKQKEGAMASSKFVLAQNKDKDWVVNIAKVHGSEDVAKKLLKDLEEKAQKINAGGTWDYVTLPEGYFFKFPDFKGLKEVTVNSIDVLLKAPKDPC